MKNFSQESYSHRKLPLFFSCPLLSLSKKRRSHIVWYRRYGGEANVRMGRNRFIRFNRCFVYPISYRRIILLWGLLELLCLYFRRCAIRPAASFFVFLYGVGSSLPCKSISILFQIQLEHFTRKKIQDKNISLCKQEIILYDSKFNESINSPKKTAEIVFSGSPPLK
jgi:hypothetical protein